MKKKFISIVLLLTLLTSCGDSSSNSISDLPNGNNTSNSNKLDEFISPSLKDTQSTTNTSNDNNQTNNLHEAVDLYENIDTTGYLDLPYYSLSITVNETGKEKTYDPVIFFENLKINPLDYKIDAVSYNPSELFYNTLPYYAHDDYGVSGVHEVEWCKFVNGYTFDAFKLTENLIDSRGILNNQGELKMLFGQHCTPISYVVNDALLLKNYTVSRTDSVSLTDRLPLIEKTDERIELCALNGEVIYTFNNDDLVFSPQVKPLIENTNNTLDYGIVVMRNISGFSTKETHIGYMGFDGEWIFDIDNNPIILDHTQLLSNSDTLTVDNVTINLTPINKNHIAIVFIEKSDNGGIFGDYCINIYNTNTKELVDTYSAVDYMFKSDKFYTIESLGFSEYKYQYITYSDLSKTEISSQYYNDLFNQILFAPQSLTEQIGVAEIQYISNFEGNYATARLKGLDSQIYYVTIDRNYNLLSEPVKASDLGNNVQFLTVIDDIVYAVSNADAYTIPTYWNSAESESGKYNFNIYDINLQPINSQNLRSYYYEGYSRNYGCYLDLEGNEVFTGNLIIEENN